MLNLFISILQSNRRFTVLVVIMLIVISSVLVAFHTELLPTVSELFYAPHEVSTMEGTFWMIIALSEHLNEIFSVHAEALTDITIQSDSEDTILTYLRRFSTLPGVNRTFCLIDGTNLISLNEFNPDINVDSLRNKRQIFESYHLGGIHHPKKFHNWIVNKIRFINLYTGSDTLRLILSAFDSTGNHFKVIPEDEFESSLIKYLFAVEIDEGWLREAIPSHMEREFYDKEIFALWSMAIPERNDEVHGAGVIGLGDTLWWVGLKSVQTQLKAKGLIQDWPYPGSPWFQFRTVTEWGDDELKNTDKALSRHRTILLFTDISSVIIAVFLMIGLILIRKQWLARQFALAHLAHSIKTPVSRIRLDTDSLLEEMVASPAEERDIITAIGHECGRMERAVQSAALSLEEGKRILSLETCQLNEIVTETVIAWQSHFDQAGIKLKIETTDEPLSGRFDREMIAVMIDNLLDNALRHTILNLENLPAESAEVTVRLRKLEGKCEIVVDDMGGGIPKSARRHIFKRFQRVKGDAASGVTGLGLGLALVKEITESHGGKVSVCDNEIGGARFAVELPINV